MFVFYHDFLFIICSVMQCQFCPHDCSFPRHSPYHLLKSQLQYTVYCLHFVHELFCYRLNALVYKRKI
jgi:hypothetical protein